MTLLPPFWFLGAQETLSGGFIDRLPRRDLPRWLELQEARATSEYRAAVPAFQTLAARALIAFVGVLALALSTYTWNSRRLPFPPVATRADQYAGPGVVARLVMRTLARAPATRAGFFFTVHCLLRSAPHRLVLAACTAVSLALATATFQVALEGQLDPRAPRASGFVTQTLVLGILLAGLGHVMRIPGDLRANRLFHLAWLGEKDRYVDGVNRAAAAILIVPALLALFPTHLLLFGWPLASAHLLTGLLLALVVLEALAAGRRALPFASSYSPPADLNTRGPVIGIGAAVGNLDVLEPREVGAGRYPIRALALANAGRADPGAALSEGTTGTRCDARRARLLSVGDGPAGSHRRAPITHSRSTVQLSTKLPSRGAFEHCALPLVAVGILHLSQLRV